MLKKFFVYLQYIVPQHLWSRVMGTLADSKIIWLKNLLIFSFIKIYKVDLASAAIQDPKAYPDFNSFFIRKLQSNARPIAKDFVSPVDGIISQIGHINKNLLFQAKNFYFSLETLLANDETLAKTFSDGEFVTLYLAPHNYHRVHMPIAGKLKKTIYVPGKLFSVNRTTSQFIPNLYGRNERLICIFETEAGLLSVILVGALIVGSIQTVWMQKAIRSNQVIVEEFKEGIFLEKGAELGYFKMGSTVILLAPEQTIAWSSFLKPGLEIQFGQDLGVVV